MLGFAIRHPFPLSVFSFCVEQRTQAAEGSMAVSSCEQFWREPGVLPTQTVPGFCSLHWDKTQHQCQHTVGPKLCLLQGFTAWLCTALRGGGSGKTDCTASLAGFVPLTLCTTFPSSFSQPATWKLRLISREAVAVMPWPGVGAGGCPTHSPLV